MTQGQQKTAPLTDKSDTKPAEIEVKCPSADEVVISYDASADEGAMTAAAISALKEICSKACINSVKVTSTARSAKDQARIMYDMIEARGVAFVKNLYAASGDKVVDVYADSKKKIIR